MINDFALACAIDESPAYFTYHEETMLIIQSARDAKADAGSFQLIEPFIEALISHESIHVLASRGPWGGATLDDGPRPHPRALTSLSYLWVIP